MICYSISGFEQLGGEWYVRHPQRAQSGCSIPPRNDDNLSIA